MNKNMKHIITLFCFLMLLSCSKSPLEKRIDSNPELKEGITKLMAERLEKDSSYVKEGYTINLIIDYYLVNDSIEKYNLQPIIDPELLECYPCKEIISYHGFYIFYREPVIDNWVVNDKYRISEKEYNHIMKQYFPKDYFSKSQSGRVIIYEPLPLYLYFKNGSLIYKKRTYGSYNHKLRFDNNGNEVYW